MKITIDTQGEVEESLVLNALKAKNIQAIVDKKAEEKIEALINQYFNGNVITQDGREQFKQTLNRMIIEHSFDGVFKDMLKDAIGKYLKDKNVENMIKTACKEHITTIVQKLKSI